jgi:hypothetical protein
VAERLAISGSATPTSQGRPFGRAPMALVSPMSTRLCEMPWAWSNSTTLSVT